MILPQPIGFASTCPLESRDSARFQNSAPRHSGPGSACSSQHVTAIGFIMPFLTTPCAFFMYGIPLARRRTSGNSERAARARCPLAQTIASQWVRARVLPGKVCSGFLERSTTKQIASVVPRFNSNWNDPSARLQRAPSPLLLSLTSRIQSSSMYLRACLFGHFCSRDARCQFDHLQSVLADLQYAEIGDDHVDHADAS
jgi:hypothetical protein